MDSKNVKCLEAETGMVVTRDREEGAMGSCWSGYRGAVMQGEYILEI